MEKKTVKVPNINCVHCIHTIESELSGLPYISSVKANLGSKEVEIEWENVKNWPNIVALLKGINYPPQE
jgi:copper chaperone CopZ